MGIRRDNQRLDLALLGVRVFDLLKAGRSVNQTAAELGINRGRLYRALKAAELYAPGPDALLR